ncbi:MAG: RAMP superfamily CRISPR-associated protein [Succinivibrio sp.]
MYIARFILQTVTPLHCGGGSNPSLDQPVSRDPFGMWRIQGSSIAGVLRSFLRDTDAELENVLFGHQSRNFSSFDQRASLVWCSDANLLDFDEEYAFKKIACGNEIGFGVGPFVRDHVNIDLDKGTAKDGGKYDEEIVPPGVKFSLEIKLDGWNENITDEQSSAFLKLCAALKQNLISFGGKSVSGYGKVQCTYCSVKKLNLCTKDDLEIYLNLSDSSKFSENEGEEITLPDIEELILRDNELYSGKLELPLVSNGPILVGGANSKDSEVDMVCLMTPVLKSNTEGYIYKYTIPGSSLRGVIRHRIHYILTALDRDKENDDELNSIFGTVSGSKGCSGHIKCFDTYLDVDKTQHVQHVAIDRFTGGAIDGALFDEAPIWEKGLLLNTKIEFADLTAFQVALLMHALLDICQGDAPIGGGTNRGNGFLRLKDLDKGIITALKNVKAQISHGKEVLDVQNTEQLNQWLDDLDGELIK